MEVVGGGGGGGKFREKALAMQDLTLSHSRG